MTQPLARFFRQPWVLVTAAIFLIKGGFLLVDSAPQFFMGDSGSFVHTARTGWIPLDRSFAYGYLIRFVALERGSLLPLILLQTAASGGMALLAFVLLKNYLHVRTAVAFAAAMVVALDPLLMYYERTVLTDVLAAFLMAAYVTSMLWIALRPRVILIAAFQLLSVLVISMRTSFLPLVLIVSAALPVLAAGFHYQALKSAPRRRSYALLTGVCALVSVVLFFWIPHNAYKELNGELTGYPPAYLYSDGLFLIAFLSPLLEPEDASHDLLSDLIQEKQDAGVLTFDLRNHQMFAENGLAPRARRRLGQLLANTECKRAAIEAMRRDPKGVARLGLQTWSAFFERSISETLENDANLQVQRPLPADFCSVLAEDFGLEATSDWGRQEGAAKSYLLALRGWIRVLLVTPFVALVVVLAVQGRCRIVAILSLVLSSTLLASHYVVAPSVVRYLLILGFLLPILLGILADRLLRRDPAPSGSTASLDPSERLAQSQRLSP